MAMPAVGEKPAVPAADEEKPAGSLDDAADDSADDDDPDTGNDAGSDDSDDDGDGGDPDAAAQYEAERAAAAQAEADKAAEARVLARLKAEADAREEEATQARLAERYEDAEAKAVTALTAVTHTARDENGNPVTLALSPEQAKAALAAFEEYRGEASAVENKRVMNALAEVASSIIKDEATQKAFNAKVGGKDAKVWISELMEHAAPTTEAFKKAVTDAKAEGFDLGKGAPGGQVSQGGGKAAGRPKTFEQLEAAYGAGQTTDAEDQEYLRLKAERGG